MKNLRKEKILELISEKSIETQEELIAALKEAGYEVTQSTVSRDIKQLGLVKIQSKNGGYRYASTLKSAEAPLGADERDHYLELFKRSANKVVYAMNDVVVKCDTGMAQSTCVAIEKLFADMFVGTLAGDDTIFIITESEAAAGKMAASMRAVMR